LHRIYHLGNQIFKIFLGRFLAKEITAAFNVLMQIQPSDEGTSLGLTA
jgi:hypothetical protein